jgi:ATP-dependent helicase HrpB
MARVLPSLPVVDALPALRAALAGPGAAVLSAPPGSGKTTIVPLALFEEPWLGAQRIVILEPRRVAARAAAARMAHLWGERVGETIGYQVRFDRRIGPRTRVEVLTEGLLARRLQADAELPGVGLVIFDEFHERSLDAELALALTLDVRAQLRPDLRVLVMSATLDTKRVAALLHDAPVVEASGRMFDVDVQYIAQRGEFEVAPAVARGVMRGLAETKGDILAFLPGGREIRDCRRALESQALRGVSLHDLYGDLPAEAQDAALQPARDGSRKVILATNIAQTSLTVEGVTTVVDGGLVRVAQFDLGAGADRLETRRVSRASADQRAGRAGRLGPGTCYRLWSAEQHGSLPAHDTPEILAADLSRFALELSAWGIDDPARAALLDAPPEANWRYARDLLLELGAVDAQGRITAHGREMARLPAPPRRAHLLLLAQKQGLGGVAAWVAALLDERDPGSSDLATAVQAFVSGRVDPGARRRVRESAAQLARVAGSELADSAEERDVARVVSWAFPERIARRRDGVRGRNEIAFACEDGGEARLRETDALAASEWLAIAHWEPGSQRRIRLAARLDESDLRRDHASRIARVEDVHWDAQSQAVVAEEQLRLGALVLERKPLRSSGGGDAVRAAMLEGVRALGLQALPWTGEARQLQARVQSLRAWRPEDAWPDVGDDALLSDLESWLAPQLGGVTRRDHLSRIDLEAALSARLDHVQRRELEKLAPTHVAVPTGSRIRLEYSATQPPVLAVRLQEMFGCRDTPRVGGGRVAVVVHLLSPAQRPLAVTQDLAGFWARTYPEVKKEMKGRYPRHAWPDDPLVAAPTRRAKPRGT